MKGLQLAMKQPREIILVSLLAALTAIGAFIQIPLGFYPVPVTLQTFFVFFAGLCLAPKSAMYSQLVYVILGLIGLPIFTKGGGIHYVLDVTFGYLLGFIAAAPLLSMAARKFLYSKISKLRFAASALGVTLLIEGIGVLYMALISGLYLGEPLTIERAIYLFLIFLPLDLIKCAIAIPLVLEIRKRVPAMRT